MTNARESIEADVSDGKYIQALSVVIPVLADRHDNLQTLVQEYNDTLSPHVSDLEFVVVLDGPVLEAAAQLETIAATADVAVTTIQLSRSFGESNALVIGFENSRADLVLTLPAYRQVEETQLPELFSELGDWDMVVARRWPRTDSGMNQWMTRVFHQIIRWITRYDFRDLGCGVRLINRRVLDEVSLYGDQHRFLPMLAAHRGFRVREKSINQSKRESRVRVYAPRIYATRILDVVTVFFLTRFTKKPLRFFGMVGGSLLTTGLVALLVVSFQRIAFAIELGDRPALVIATLLIVLGAQLIALGLVGELVIFANARRDKEYTVGELVNFGAPRHGERPTSKDV